MQKRKRLAAILAILNAVVILHAQTLNVRNAYGWLETAVAEWDAIEEAAIYEVLCSEAGTTPAKVDNQLIRQYPDHWRVDIPGLKAGQYTITVKALDKDKNIIAESNSETIDVKAHTREGWAFAGADGDARTSYSPGAYNMDGTLKNGAKVLYVTAKTVNSIKLGVINERGTEMETTGLTAILKAREKGYDKTPLVIRFIGLIKATDIEGLKSGTYILLNGANTSNRMIENITVEGIGNDATVSGIGFHCKRSHGIEIRNLGIMLFGDDGVSLEGDNSNVWIHNCDFFYGAPGSDKDQFKGDGAIDMKYNSTLVTISYNHFWDSGKTTFAGGATEEKPIYFTYHHNWFDHSDSRHPRLCHADAHVYNNYFDGNRTMCLLATENSSAFVENNYYRNCPYPIMINMQGSNYERWPDGTQPGGMVKAFNNIFAGNYQLYSQNERPEDFDAYMVDSRDEKIPNTVKSRYGGNVYSNFDTSETFYNYIPETPDNIPLTVKAMSGRTDGGDLQWEFNDATDDMSTDITPGLYEKIQNYSSSLVAVQNEGEDSGNEGGDISGGDSPTTVGDISGGVCELISQGSSSGITISGTTSNDKGTVTIGGIDYSCCLKIGSSTNITFTTSNPFRLTLYFNNNSNGKELYVNDVPYKVENAIIQTQELPAGTYTIRKKSGESNLYFIHIMQTNTSIVDINESENINYHESTISNPSGKRVCVYDSLGRIVTISSEQEIDLKNEIPGIYIIKADGHTCKINIR